MSDSSRNTYCTLALAFVLEIDSAMAPTKGDMEALVTHLPKTLEAIKILSCMQETSSQFYSTTSTNTIDKNRRQDYRRQDYILTHDHVLIYNSTMGKSMNQEIRVKNVGTCEVKAIHEDIVTEVIQRMPNQERVQSLAALFKIFGDGTRLSILWALGESEMCVCDICALLNLKQSAVSHQLNKLKMSKIVKHRREGKVMFCSLADDHVRKILEMGMEHVSE